MQFTRIWASKQGFDRLNGALKRFGFVNNRTLFVGCLFRIFYRYSNSNFRIGRSILQKKLYEYVGTDIIKKSCY
jgi:hypothetical protein